MSTQPPIRLDRSSPIPLYFQVAEQLERAIVDGILAPGERIANEVALASELGLSRPTMRQAIQLLVDKGMLVRKRGVGTQVVHGAIRRPVELTSLYDDLDAAGQHPHTEVLSADLVATNDEIATTLQIRPGEPAWALERLRCIDHKPLALMRNYLPAETIDLAEVDLAQTGLYESLRRTGIQLRIAEQRIGARRANAREARLLDEKRGAPLLTMRRTAYDDGGRVVEFGTHVYRPELYSFEVTLVDR